MVEADFCILGIGWKGAVAVQSEMVSPTLDRNGKYRIVGYRTKISCKSLVVVYIFSKNTVYMYSEKPFAEYLVFTRPGFYS